MNESKKETIENAENVSSKTSNSVNSDVSRITLRIKPEYRAAVELIAKHRQTSLNEALEFCVISAARDYQIDGKSIYDYILPEMFELDEIRESMYLNEADKKENYQKSLLLFNKMKEEFLRLPVSLQTPKAAYIGKILSEYDSSLLASLFNAEILKAILEEFWKTRMDENLLKQTMLAFSQFKQKLRVDCYRDGVEIVMDDDGGIHVIPAVPF